MWTDVIFLVPPRTTPGVMATFPMVPLGMWRKVMAVTAVLLARVMTSAAAPTRVAAVVSTAIGLIVVSTAIVAAIRTVMVATLTAALAVIDHARLIAAMGATSSVAAMIGVGST